MDRKAGGPFHLLWQRHSAHREETRLGSPQPVAGSGCRSMWTPAQTGSNLWLRSGPPRTTAEHAVGCNGSTASWSDSSACEPPWFSIDRDKGDPAGIDAAKKQQLLKRV